MAETCIPWGRLKDTIESLGIVDDDPIAGIDIHNVQSDSEVVVVKSLEGHMILDAGGRKENPCKLMAAIEELVKYKIKILRMDCQP